MQSKKIFTALSLLCFGAAAWAAGDGPQWGYSGKAGPAHWGKLDPKFLACAEGKSQSPINLSTMVEGDLSALSMDYAQGGHEILNNGHTVQVNYRPGSTLKVDGRLFELKQFHFHAPSENHVDGKSFPLEVHFVHADEAGNLAVVAILFEEGAENPTLAQAWTRMPTKAGEKNALAQAVSAAALLPAGRDYYRFSGSLTTPPCSEGVWWLVMKETVTASKAQIAQFAAAVGHPNNRPVQPLNARVVVE